MSIEKLTEELNQEKQELKQDIDEANRRTKELTRQLERVEASLAALHGKSPRKRPTRKKRASQSRQVDRPAVELVRELAADVLQQEGALPEAQLEERISQRLREQSQPSSGLREVLEKALVPDQFENSLTGWKLVEIRIPGQGQTAVA